MPSQPTASGTRTSPSGALPNGSANPSSRPTPPASKRPAATAGHGGAPAATSPAPGVAMPVGARTPAFVVFRDSVLQSDLDWLRGQGFTIANVNDAAHAVSVGVPDGYSGNPKANPRVVRFTIAMR